MKNYFIRGGFKWLIIRTRKALTKARETTEIIVLTAKIIIKTKIKMTTKMIVNSQILKRLQFKLKPL
jgi:hypothetical protein